MLRITETERTGSSVTFLIEGRVGQAGLREIDRVCDGAFALGLAPILDLSSLSFVERAAIEGFRALIGRPVKMVNCTPFLARQLKLDECNA